MLYTCRDIGVCELYSVHIPRNIRTYQISRRKAEDLAELDYECTYAEARLPSLTNLIMHLPHPWWGTFRGKQWSRLANIGVKLVLIVHEQPPNSWVNGILLHLHGAS